MVRAERAVSDPEKNEEQNKRNPSPRM